MRDDLARRIIKKIALARYMTDLAFTRLIKRLQGEPRFTLRGSCNRCGGCCETPVIPVSPLLFGIKTTKILILVWHKMINGFRYAGENRMHATLIFRCTHFDPKTRLCDSYDSRPGMCRDYPRNLIYDAYPDFLTDCGYYAVYKKAEQFRKALDRTDLPEEKKEELFRKLHIKE